MDLAFNGQTAEATGTLDPSGNHLSRWTKNKQTKGEGGCIFCPMYLDKQKKEKKIPGNSFT